MKQKGEGPPPATTSFLLSFSPSLTLSLSTRFFYQVNDSAKAMTIRDGLRSMLSEGTPRAFFRGNGANVLKIAPETALKLTFNDRIKRAVGSVRSSSSDSGSSSSSSSVSLSPGERFVAGAAAGALAQSAIYPLELIRTRLAICPKGTYRGIADAAARVFRSEGPRAFYRGLCPSLIGILPYAGVDIAAFETLKEALLDAYEPRGEPPPPAAVIAAGAASSSVAQFCSYPLALVRTRLQAQGAGGRPIKYSGMVDVIRKTVASEGVRGLYKGKRFFFSIIFFFDLDLTSTSPLTIFNTQPQTTKNNRRAPQLVQDGSLRRNKLVRVRGDQERAGAGQEGLRRRERERGRGVEARGEGKERRGGLLSKFLLLPSFL